MPQEQQKIQITMLPEVQRGFYANLARILHTQEEFVLDFLNIVPPTGIAGSRVFMSPGHAKRLAEALADNIRKYEEQYGKIDIAKEPVASSQEIGFASKQ